MLDDDNGKLNGSSSFRISFHDHTKFLEACVNDRDGEHNDDETCSLLLFLRDCNNENNYLYAIDDPDWFISASKLRIKL